MIEERKSISFWSYWDGLSLAKKGITIAVCGYILLAAGMFFIDLLDPKPPSYQTCLWRAGDAQSDFGARLKKVACDRWFNAQ